MAKSCGQPIWLKLGTEVGCDEIFQNLLWLTSLTFSFGVTGWGGSHFLPCEYRKNQPSRGYFESVIRACRYILLLTKVNSGIGMEVMQEGRSI